MNFVLDPDIVHIEEESWEDEGKKDRFLQYFLDCLNFIENSRNSIFFWSNQLEALLWDNPRLPPWRRDIDARNMLVPIIYRKFNSPNKAYIEINSPFDIYNFRPTLIEVARFQKNFHELCGTLVEQDQDFSMLLSINQQIPQNSEFSFLCSPPETTKTIIGENIFSKWLKNNEFINHIWPHHVDDREEFEKIVNICTSVEENIYVLRITDDFVRSILGIELRYKLALIDAVKRRLSMTRDEAVSCSLREETIDNEVRIRITPRPTSTRLHFTFDNNVIVLQRFYRVGEHDDGL